MPGARRLSLSRPCRVSGESESRSRANRYKRFTDLPKVSGANCVAGESVSTPGAEFVEVFLQEASEHLQFLREYSGILQDPYPVPEDIERLYIGAHTLAGTSASYGYPLFSEVAGKLAHIFQYAMNASIGQEAAGPLVEFISEGVAVLESDLIMISTNGVESIDDITAFKI